MMYRNNKILELARECPQCMYCSVSNFGNIVAAHSNQLRHGKGTSVKSHDFYVAYLCAECHAAVDIGVDSRTQQKLNRFERAEIWERAWKHTIVWLFLNGHIKIT